MSGPVAGKGLVTALEQAARLEGLAGDPAVAAAHLRARLELYEQLGVPEADEVRRRLG